MEKKEEYAMIFALIMVFIALVREAVVYAASGILVLDFTAMMIAIVGLVPWYLVRYTEYQRIKTMEERFPDFLRDLSEARRAGMTLPHAIRFVSKLDYSHLTAEIKKMSAMISWGVSFEKALTMFSKRCKTRHIQRSSSIIIEADRSGGNITNILDSVSKYSRMMREIEKEQAGVMRGYTIIIYIAFLVFLAIVIILVKLLITGIGGVSGISSIGGGMVGSARMGEFKTLLFQMSIIQGVFTGLVAGKVGEGSVLEGIKHSVVMVILAIIAFQFFVW